MARFSICFAGIVGFAMPLFAAGTEFVLESARDIPIVYEVDVVVAGGSSAAVASAAEAAKSGAKVFLASQKPYLGEDLCAHMRLWSSENGKVSDPLVKAMFQEKQQYARPAQIKSALDRELLDNGVQFLTSCYPVGLLVDKEGRPSGIVIANRSGRQAITAKVVVDATGFALLAEKAGASIRGFKGGPAQFQCTVVASSAPTGPGLKIKDLGQKKFGTRNISSSVFECVFELPLADESFPSLAGAEQAGRDLVSVTNRVLQSERLYWMPQGRVEGVQSMAGAWPGAAAASLDAFRPRGVDNLFVLSARADVERPAVEAMLKPSEFVALGRKVGKAAAEQARSRAKPGDIRVAGTANGAGLVGEIKEVLNGVRPTQSHLPTVKSPEQALRVLGRYDVVVVGGGTSGTPAGIGAARRGEKVLVVEMLHELGGVGTLGMIGSYWYGNRTGFTAEVPDQKKGWTGSRWDPEEKAEWWRRELRKAGADIWFETIGCGAVVLDKKVVGVVVATPQGRGVVLAKVVIDATGNSDIAVAAGAECIVTGGDEIAVQGTGLPPVNPGDTVNNTDFTFTDETDLVDVWQLMVSARDRYSKEFDVGQLVDTRERRRIVGDYTLTLADLLTGRAFPDTLVLASSNYDTHGYTTDPMTFFASPPGLVYKNLHVPYRCLLPKGLDGIIVVGLGLSAHRDAMPLIRMMPDLQNLGYAVGVAASMIRKAGCPTRQLDVNSLQKHLIEKGSLTEKALASQEKEPADAARLASAVKALMTDPAAAKVVFANPRAALPMLKDAFDKAAGPNRLGYARALGLLGDASGVDDMVRALSDVQEWGAGWSFKGSDQEGSNMNEVDRLVIALGMTGDKRALDPILRLAGKLDADSDFSHHRAVALALAKLRDQKASEILAALLGKTGMTGYSIQTIEQAKKEVEKIKNMRKSHESTRDEALREIMFARVLYRCGDKDGLGRQILEEYKTDLRGHFARHAHAVLENGASSAR